MESLAEMNCVRPEKGDELTEDEIASYSEQIPDWERLQEEGTPKIRRAFSFDDFSEAMAFTVQVGMLAEKQNHHPAIMTEWGATTVTFWTHATEGLHRNDFIMAAKTDRLYG